MREIVYDRSKKATVLDFELLQSTTPYTFHNIKGFMSGKKGFDYEQKQGYGIASLYGLLQSKGYYTLLQDDSCWYDEWGSLFTNNAYQNKTPGNLLEFAQQWDYFNDAVGNYHVDDMGLSHTACAAFKQHKSTNQLQDDRLCFSGKPYAEYFLNYTTDVFRAYRHSGKKRPIFAYTHLGVGHDMSGTRVRQIDDSLAQYVQTMAKDQDTLTVLFSNHGPKTTQYSFHTMEGRAEVYDAMLFVILPKKVAEKLQIQKTRALITNQHRLLTTIDLHDAVMSIVDPTKFSKNPATRGIFSEASTKRTCADLTMKPSAVCKCANWYKMYPGNHAPFTWLAELGLGEINNAIQEEYLTGSNASGFGKCQRLVGDSFWKIRHRVERVLVDLGHNEENFSSMLEMRQTQIKQSNVFLAFLGGTSNKFTYEEYHQGHLKNPGKKCAIFCFRSPEDYSNSLVDDESIHLTDKVKMEVRKTQGLKSVLDNILGLLW
ncbi:hypothetical protein QZH41_004637 [Actinostola sp. cb2023]|nr:hypothetical protein QZH41_004637 [Actinostola sp. cb2023]